MIMGAHGWPFVMTYSMYLKGCSNIHIIKMSLSVKGRHDGATEEDAED